MDEGIAGPVKHILHCQVAFLNGQRGGNEQNPIYEGIKNVLVQSIGVIHGARSGLFGAFSLFSFSP
jgi:hypothetical protein